MNFKQFLKPDWKKILLTIILLMVLGFISLLTKKCVEGYGTLECFTSGECGWFCCYLLPMPICGQIAEIILFPALLIESYIISCLIIWIYDKVKKKV